MRVSSASSERGPPFQCFLNQPPKDCCLRPYVLCRQSQPIEPPAFVVFQGIKTGVLDQFVEFL